MPSCPLATSTSPPSRAFTLAVASQRDAVTDVVAGAAVHGVAVVEHATFPQQVDGGPVEAVDDVVGPGQHDRSLTGVEGGGQRPMASLIIELASAVTTTRPCSR